MNTTPDEWFADLARFSPWEILLRALLWSLLPALLVLALSVLDRLLLTGGGSAWHTFRRRWRERLAVLTVPLAILPPVLALALWAPWQDFLAVTWGMTAVSIVSSALASLLAHRELTTFPRRSLLPWAGGLLVASWFSLVLGDGLTQGSRLFSGFLSAERQLRAEQQQNTSDPRALFEQNCSGCHGQNTKIVGPPLTEIAVTYKDNAGGIVAWAKAPGRKREGAPMPSMAHVGDDKLAKIAAFMLATGTARP